MEAKLSTLFLGQGLYGQRLHYKKIDKVRFYSSHPHRLFPASCKMRQRNFSSQSKRQQVKKIYPGHPANANQHPNDDEKSSPENSTKENAPRLHPNSDNEIETVVEADHEDGGQKSDLEISSAENSQTPHQDFNSDVETLEEAEHADDKEMGALVNDVASLAIVPQGEEQESGIQLQDLIGMIRNAEKNIHLLNQARIRTLKDLERIFGEKEALQGEINILEKKLAETDARLRVAAQQKIHVELLEDQLEKLREELSSRSNHEVNMHDVLNSVPLINNTIDVSLNKELDLLRTENMSLKNDLQALKEELSNIKGTDVRVQMLEEERSDLAATLKELEFKLSASQEDVSKLSSLKSECKSLYEKVDNLQALLDKATKQADQAILVLQQNQELRKKVDKLEESIEEANMYKISSEKLQKYNELMQQKLKLLDERLQRSDEEIHSYVQLYQDAVKEFQETLDNLKEESKARAPNLPVDHMPWEFWSHLLLMIDGWFFEKKISEDDASLLREMVWKRDVGIYDAYLSCKEKGERQILATFLRLAMSPTRAGLHVIHIAAEMAPVAKVGGLGDVVTGLGKALQKKGHLVELVLPKYDCMQYELVRDLRALDVVVESYFDGQLFKNKVWSGTVEGLPVYFIEPHHPGNLFWRGQFYGEHDDFKRFSFFSRAALELILQSGKKPDIIHCHDWQTAFVAPLYWDIYVPKGLNSARICFTCHNFEYQGIAPASELASCGLDVNHLNRPDRMQDNTSHDRVNPVKGAIVFSNIVTTVSPTYAQEARSSEGGQGLHATLSSHSKKFVGILNGIDTDAWNPATDSYLKVQYNAYDIGGKMENKEALRRQLGLSSADARRPLVGSITRLVPQKGVHLIRHAIYRTLEMGGQFVLLGSSPVTHIQREFEDIANHFQKHEHIRLILKYDESLSHLIYAASDMFIIPSIFEPCGLTQMIAMRYGSIPITRKTGGLNDSVFDVDDDNIPVQFRNGYTFLTADEQAFNSALGRAFDHYNNNSESWKELVQKVMTIDFSWDTSASMYEELYEKAVARARASSRT